LCFTNPRPTPETIGRFYPSIYRPHRTATHRHLQSGLLRRLQFWRRNRRRDPRILWNGKGRLLDFGCGSGAFLARMRQDGWQVTGVDTSEAAVDRVRGEMGIRALLGSLPHHALNPASFEVITMWHSLEHVHSPLDVLRAARELLVPGGRLFIAVPNIDSLPFRWFGATWYGLDLPRHLTHFAPWTLQLMLERSGFRVGPIRMVRHSDCLCLSVYLVCSRNDTRFAFHKMYA